MRLDVTVERGPFEMIPHWLLDEEISAQAIRLYLVLRRHGDREGRSYPSRRRLGEQMGTSPSTVDRAKAELVEAGAICERQRPSDEGDYTSNEYHVHWDQRHDCGNRPAHDEGYPAGDDTSPAGDGTGAPPVMNELIPIKNLDIKNIRSIGSRTPVHKPVDNDPAFNAFWDTYPRKVAKGAARRAWAKARLRAEAETIIAGAERYRDDPNRTDEYTAHPATWLNGDRWLDEALPARTGRAEAKATAVMDVIARAAERDRGEIEG